MAEPIDFERMAGALIERVDGEYFQPHARDDLDRQAEAELIHDVVEQLRLVWNARGAADLVKIETELSATMGATAAEPYLKNLDRLLRGLDR